MKCLSLWEPWATLMAIGAKRIETRSWYTPYRGPLLIHAAKKRDRGSLVLMQQEPFKGSLAAAGITSMEQLHFGCILCKVELVDCRLSTCAGAGHRKGLPYSLKPFPHRDEWSFGDFSIGRLAWMTSPEGLVRFKTPVPLKAWQGIFNVPDELVAEQLAATEVNLG